MVIAGASYAERLAPHAQFPVRCMRSPRKTRFPYDCAAEKFQDSLLEALVADRLHVVAAW
ncbi:MAG: hypothetical protein WDN31_07915 [Hyphomicrobium sp.]